MTEPSAWSNTDAKEIESLVVKYAKEGMSTSQIGIVLRDKHAVPNARLVLGKRIGAVLAENDLGGSYPEDLMNLMRQAVAIIDHLTTNHRDIHNKRSLELTEAKIRRLGNYYRAEGRLAKRLEVQARPTPPHRRVIGSIHLSRGQGPVGSAMNDLGSAPFFASLNDVIDEARIFEI